jgi:hypothetical protein
MWRALWCVVAYMFSIVALTCHSAWLFDYTEELRKNRTNGTWQEQAVNCRTAPHPSHENNFNARFSRCEWALDLFMKFDCRRRWGAVAWEPECRNWPGGSLSLSRNPWSLAAPPLCPACSNIILNCYIIMVIIRAKGGKKEWGLPPPPLSDHPLDPVEKRIGRNHGDGRLWTFE